MVVESIPVVDFSDFKSNPKKVAQEVFEACKSIGFFYMINHDLPEQDIDKAFELVQFYIPCYPSNNCTYHPISFF